MPTTDRPSGTRGVATLVAALSALFAGSFAATALVARQGGVPTEDRHLTEARLNEMVQAFSSRQEELLARVQAAEEETGLLREQTAGLQEQLALVPEILEEVAHKQDQIEVVTAETLGDYNSRRERRGRSLGDIIHNIGASGGDLLGKGCYQLDDAQSGDTIDLSPGTPSTTNVYPSCFIFTGTVSAVTFTNCKTSKYYVGASTAKSHGGIRKFTLINDSSNTVVITAKRAGVAASIQLDPETATTAYCYASSGDADDMFFQDDFMLYAGLANTITSTDTNSYGSATSVSAGDTCHYFDEAQIAVLSIPDHTHATVVTGGVSGAATDPVAHIHDANGDVGSTSLTFANSVTHALKSASPTTAKGCFASDSVGAFTQQVFGFSATQSNVLTVTPASR